MGEGGVGGNRRPGPFGCAVQHPSGEGQRALRWTKGDSERGRRQWATGEAALDLHEGSGSYTTYSFLPYLPPLPSPLSLSLPPAPSLPNLSLHQRPMALKEVKVGSSSVTSAI